MHNETSIRIKRIERLLISLVIIFIAVGFIIGGMNSAFAKSDNLQLKEKVHTIYLLYETVFRTGIVVLSSILSLRLMKLRKEQTTMRKQNLLFFSLFMSFLLVVVPLFTGLMEISIAVMPFPWSSMPFQLLRDGYFFSTHFENTTISALLAIYLMYQVIVFMGTLIFGRRFHCSMICPFSGAHAESFSLVLPLFVHKGKPKANKSVKKWMPLIKYSMFSFSIILLGVMAMDVFLGHTLINFKTLRNIEMFKYVGFEIILLQVLYVVYNGRGYCYYCPAGTAIGLLSKIAGQQIETNHSKCVGCGKCDHVCEMGMNISEKAIIGEPLQSINCLGCGHCVDQCPVQTLNYSTTIMRYKQSRKHQPKTSEISKYEEA